MGIRKLGNVGVSVVDNVSTVASVKTDETRTREREEKGEEMQLGFRVNTP